MLLRSIAQSTPATLAVGAHQYAYIFQGNGNRPSRIDLTNGVAQDMGMDTPVSAPTVAMSGDPKYYVSRFDVVEGGLGYSVAPTVTLVGGEPEREAVGRSYLTGTSVREVEATQNGRGYKTTPTVSLGSSHGKGATFTAVLGTGSGGQVVPLQATSSLSTALSSYKVITSPANYPCLPALRKNPVAVTGYEYVRRLDSTGGVEELLDWSEMDSEGSTWNAETPSVASGMPRAVFSVNVKAPPSSQGGVPSRAEIVITFNTVSVGGDIYYCKDIVSVSFRYGGAGYFSSATIRRPNMTPRADGSLTDASDCGSATGGLAVRLDSLASLSPTTTTPSTGSSQSITSVTVNTGGTGYSSPPRLTITSDSGGGGELEAVVKDGIVVSVTVKRGGSYSAVPTVTAEGGGATAAAIVRAHIRGRYDCYYRYLDDTPEDRGGPIPSSLSPVTTIDAGDGVGLLLWTVPLPTYERAKTVELWRTTSDEAYTVYRVASMPATEADDKTTIQPPPKGTLQFRDDLTDLELQDYNRDLYAALPVLLPNGELNANRFGVPPGDKAVAVMFQDRLWMAVDTSGDSPNTIRFSEYNEPESCPDINELTLQTNVKGHDHITALIPYGASLGVMQARHSYRLSYVSQPIIDANLQVAGYRGCLNQRCWDEFEGLIYCMDAQGVYAMDQSGQSQPLSLGIRDLFDNAIDFSKSEWFSVTADRKARCLRVAVRMRYDAPGKYPTQMLCYSFDAQGWWKERYPAPLVGSATVTDFVGVSRCVYGSVEGRMFEVNSGHTDTAIGALLSVSLTDPGSGYTKTPTVLVEGDGVGAVVETAAGPDGSLLGLYLRCGGYGYTTASIKIDPPPSGQPAEATCTFGDNPVAKIPCWYKSGNMEYPHDSLPVEMQDKSRNVGLLFTPTSGPCDLKLRMYYNNSKHPRINVAARDRGTGVVYETQEPCVSLDMDANLLPDRISSGVCRALFSSHTVDDIQGNDRHVAFELSAERGTAGPVEIHSVDVFGVTAG